MRVPIHLLALIICSIIGPTESLAAPGRKSTCNATQAQPIAIETVRSDYNAWRGRCVALRGIAVGSRLYADRQATLERFKPFGEDVRRSIVLYYHDRGRTIRKPEIVEVVGIIGSCADHNAVVSALQASNPNDIIMVSGYCHTSLETYVRPVTIRIVPSEPIMRLLEAEVPVDQRELVEAPADLAGLGEQLAAARAMATAMATGDELTFQRLWRPEIQHDADKLDGKPAPSWLRREMREMRAQFAKSIALRRQFAAIYPLGRRQERVFVDRADLLASQTSGNAPSAYVVCWCRTPDCTGRWPVAAFDADNYPERPYLCARTNEYILFRAGTAIQVDVDAASEGFAEPTWLERKLPTG